MSKTARKVIMWVIGLLVVFSIFSGTLGDVITAADNLTNTAGMPAIIGTVAGFWWVGVLLLLIGFVMSTGGFRRRFGRRRRR